MIWKYPKGELIQHRKASRPLRMLFASYGFNSPIMREKFSRIITQDDSLQEKTCLIIPYAGFNSTNTFEREKQGLIEFGFNPDKIKLAENQFDISASIPDYIYIPGGDPFKLLHTLNSLDMLHEIKECVREKRAVYIGISAGAYLASQSIRYVMQLEDNNDINDGLFGSLGLVSECLVCHYDHYSYATLKACEEISGSVSMAIKDDQLLMWEDEKWSYIE